MSSSIPRCLDQLTDSELVAELRRLVGCERSAIAAVVSHLAELDARRLYLAAGFSSLFAYCTGALRFSEHGTYNRIEAARASRKFPVILELLASGGVNLTNLRLLAPHLTAENHAALLNEAAGKSRLQVEELLARRFPRAAVPESVRKLPAPTAMSTAASLDDGVPSDVPASAPADAANVLAAAEPPAPATAPSQELTPMRAAQRPAVVPLSCDQYKVTFTASAETWRKLRQARELLRHRVPDGDLAQVVDRALEALLEQLMRRKFAAVNRPRLTAGPVTPAAPGVPDGPIPPSEPSAASPPAGRHIPAEVRRAVWRRDGGSCGFVGRDGRRCGDRNFVEYHHLRPFAVGGPPTAANIALRCRSHNGYEAELYFGPSRLATAQPP